jgi:hypothetical protein
MCLYVCVMPQIISQRTGKSEGGSSKKKKSSSSSSGGGHSGGKGGLRAEMEGLRAHLDTTNAQRTPLSGESLRQFYRYIAAVQCVCLFVCFCSVVKCD